MRLIYNLIMINIWHIFNIKSSSFISYNDNNNNNYNNNNDNNLVSSDNNKLLHKYTNKYANIDIYDNINNSNNNNINNIKERRGENIW